MLHYFDGYVEIGLRPIAVFRKTKQPVGVKWNENWSVSRWRPYFELENDAYNMGVLLGNICDVECDNKESNEILNSLVEGTPHPIFESNRSLHHLFINPDPGLTATTLMGIEFRANRVFSVFPPSVHETGKIYQFLRDSKFPIPQMPPNLREFYFSHKKSRILYPRTKIKKDHIKTICKICGGTKYLHKKRLILEVKAFQEKDSVWMCHKCRKIDVREACRRLRK